MVCIDNVHLNIRQESTCCCLLEPATNGFEWALSQQRMAHGLRLQAMVKTEMITAETRYEETIEPESSNSSLASTSKSAQCDSLRKIYFPEKEEGDFTDFRSVDCIPTSPQAFGCPKTRNRMRISSAHERKLPWVLPKKVAALFRSADAWKSLGRGCWRFKYRVIDNCLRSFKGLRYWVMLTSFGATRWSTRIASIPPQCGMR